MIYLENLGTVNKNKVMIGNLTLWFSYETIVAFSHPSTGFVCRQNDWSTTTGKLLNEICPKKENRIPGDDFKGKLNELLEKLNLLTAE